MARGVIHNFFRRILPGQALRKLADVDNINRLANILNDIKGEGCTIYKPEDAEGRGWKIVYDGTSSDLPVKDFPVQTDVDYMKTNYARWNGSEWEGEGLAVYVNDVAVHPVSGGVKWASDGELILHIRPGGASVDSSGNWVYTYLEMYGDADVPVDPLLLWQVKFGYGDTVDNEHIFQKYIEGDIRIYKTGGDIGDPVSPQEFMRSAWEYKTTEGLNCNLATIYNSTHTLQWENEYPDGFWEWDSNSQQWKHNLPDTDARYRNSQISALVRYINGGHGYPQYIDLHDLPVMATAYLRKKVEDHCEHDGDLLDLAKEMWEELKGMCATSFASGCEVPIGMYNRDTDEWEDLFGENGLLRKTRWDTIWPRWTSIATSGRDPHDDGRWKNLKMYIEDLASGLAGYLAIYEGCVDDLDDAETDIDTLNTDAVSLSSAISGVENQADGAEGILSSSTTTYLELDARLRALEGNL